MTTEVVCRNSSIPGRCEFDDPDLKWGDDISDDLLTTSSAAIERGRVEIESSFSNRKKYSLSVTSFKFVQPGNMVEIIKDVSIIGLLIGIQLNCEISEDSISIDSQLTVEGEM